MERGFITGASSGLGATAAFLAHAGGIDVVIASAGVSYGTLTEHPEYLAFAHAPHKARKQQS